MSEVEVPVIEESASEPKKAKVGHIAFVEFVAAPGEPRHVGIVDAATKRELSTKLGDPKISQVFSIVRGRKLQFLETRKITF